MVSAPRFGRAIGSASWWVFVVAALMSSLYPFGMPRRYADYDDSIFGTGLGSSDFGWTAYTPLTDGSGWLVGDAFYGANLIVCAGLVALLVTVLAAVVEAIGMRGWPARIMTVLTPVAGATVILVAVRLTGFGAPIQLNPALAFVVVLIGVAIRELWSRMWAPRASGATGPR
ncbi:hypothetical protein [Mycolicibacterium brumae]|uniref:Uncharacterized protein n=1 Tax=Mycolicibacterium brumae TaxID=85968 RepID=A0A2G5PE57_9MYCO|nr:hypothetical protein [Mycolicibacterium brumae]MCV7192651.1 hypothetical protein [Mycolicibacterium brumae]PIB76599.1 hypothetical protein CQY22_005720 [Mycolicibacterium brumae]RWA23235.1 hypothetical protein MBRU_00015 [Mycolicibacterium brumae DSM 44177]UWW08834.1 hypothetical protein L2Z93_001905 [Mycolicibacterium brumae]